MNDDRDALTLTELRRRLPIWLVPTERSRGLAKLPNGRPTDAAVELIWEFFIEQGFARTTESAAGTAGISTRFSELRGDSPGPLLPDAKDGPALGRVEPASGTAEPIPQGFLNVCDYIRLVYKNPRHKKGRDRVSVTLNPNNAEAILEMERRATLTAPPPSVGATPSPEGGI